MNEAVKWAEVVSALVVVVSLVYLAVQIRQNTKAIRTSTGESISAAFDELVKVALSDKGNLVAFDEILFPHEREGSADARRARWAALLLLNSIERSYWAVETDTIEESVAHPITHNLVVKAMQSPAVRDALQSGYFPSSFRDHAEQVLRESEDDA